MIAHVTNVMIHQRTWINRCLLSKESAHFLQCFPQRVDNGAPPPFNFKVYAEKHCFVTPIEHCDHTSCTTDALPHP